MTSDNLDVKIGSSEWMDTIHFKDGRMCYDTEAHDDHQMPIALAAVGLVAVSLGCSCAVKLSFRKLGLDSATLPLDWNRTRIEKVIEFIQNDFSSFFSDLNGSVPVPNTGLSAFRGAGHSFWHDDLDNPEVHIKLQRRIDRFLELGKSSSQMLFVRALATSDELASADELYFELMQKFSNANTQVYLLLIVCDQTTKGPIKSTQSPGLLIFQLGREAHGAGGCDPAPYTEPVTWAVAHIQGQETSQPRQVASGFALLESGVVSPNSIGLDGMEGVGSFEASPADKKAFVVGARVEAWYWGSWYPAVVTQVPDSPGMGQYWKVVCDADPPGTSTTTHRLRAITVVPSEVNI